MKQLAKMLRLPPPVRRRKNVLKSVRATVAKVCSEPAAQVPPRPSTVGSQSSWTSPIGCWMDTRSGSQCSVTPEAILNNEQLVLPPRISRVNGWSLPLHYFQVVTWAVFVGLSSATFGIFIPLLPHVWKYIAYVVTGGIFSFHLVVHLIASCIDPADSNVRLKKNYSQPMPIFDRSKHAHVIQNQFCHLCRVTVNKKTKHCISCNKCVSGFDHHCKWINNCVGSRNYWFFFSTVASATAGMLCLIAVLLYILVQYLVNPGVLRTDPKYEDVKNTNTWLLFLPLFPVQVQTLIVVIIGMLVLLLDLLGLVHLGQLLIFHIYLKAKKMTTFEYLIKTCKEESSKHQAVRKDPYMQMEEGFLQQGDGALDSSAQGVKAKSSLLIYKCPCHFCTSVNPDRGSTAREADDAPSTSTLGLQQETTEPMKTDSAERKTEIQELRCPCDPGLPP
ncbi:probable palmitoyltransferase ZDHHC11B isoform X4 [Pongo abelii]|uniref:probable palmitoyltransferase ZDHHC11B isoform X4 n=2 Tax=Pongo abelii TaxID=9601 RepID=UPI0023E8DE88|nr:probable palmitoyltransferase ZDHHC11B isoform X4 [Pongo abelii]